MHLMTPCVKEKERNEMKTSIIIYMFECELIVHIIIMCDQDARWT